MRRVVVAFYRAVRGVVAEWLRGPLPVIELPDPDPVVLAKLSPELQRLVAQARIVRAAFLGEIDAIDAAWKIESRYHRRWERQRDETETREYQAHLAMTRASALLWDFASQSRALPPTDLAVLETRGFCPARITALVELLAPPVADEDPVPDDPPRSVSLRRAANELTALESALLHGTECDPYR